MNIETSDTATAIRPANALAAVTVRPWLDLETSTDLAELEVGGEDAGNEGTAVRLTADELRAHAAACIAVADRIEG